LAAFDIEKFGARRVLFVAHREEILRQALNTFSRILPEATFGFFSGKEKVSEADIVLASVQTLGRVKNLRQFTKNVFDYIVIDEFHHAAARSYRKLIEYFDPPFLLGLTATPERTDGGDLLALCGENLIYRCDLYQGIQQDLLCPFHYYGVPDEVDYSNIPWRNGRFKEEELTRAVATKKRAHNALDQFHKRAGSRTLAFCCSQLHADFMTDFFREKGIRSEAVHSGRRSAPRSTTLERLNKGELDVVFAVDMFNEGVDLPNVDTIMMLRPTESRILWLQQFGRGLRVAPGKDFLRVIDYIGNHRTFLLKPRTLFELGPGDHEIVWALDTIQQGELGLPPGCEVTYELEAIDILRSLLRVSKEDTLRTWYLDFREQHGERPKAVEAFHEGYTPRAARNAYGSWLRFVDSLGDMSAETRRQLEGSGGDFLNHLEVTSMTKSYKMIVIQAMLNEGLFPGEIDIGLLTKGFARIVRRSALLQEEVQPDFDDNDALQKYIEKNPVHFWSEGKYFDYDGRRFKTAFSVSEGDRAFFTELVQEIVDWRLADYLDRIRFSSVEGEVIVCKVSHANKRPILFLPDRNKHPNIPFGWTDVLVEGDRYEANFVKVAVNVIRKKGQTKNELPTILKKWYGFRVGLPGTNFRAVFRMTDSGFVFERYK
jgi:superfamily II DNA or RNA helicase